MKLSKKALSNKTHGDIEAIKTKTKLSRPTISMALKNGYGSIKVISLINEFYNQLEK